MERGREGEREMDPDFTVGWILVAVNTVLLAILYALIWYQRRKFRQTLVKVRDKLVDVGWEVSQQEQVTDQLPPGCTCRRVGKKAAQE
jgi:hypothetical protein